MFSLRQTIARSISSIALRHIAPQSATRARATPLRITQSRWFSQVIPRFAEEPVKEAEQHSVSESQSAATSSQAHAATSETTDQIPSDASTAGQPAAEHNADQEFAATSETTDQIPSNAVTAGHPAGAHNADQKLAATSEPIDQQSETDARKVLYVGNLLFEVGKDELEKVFSKFGKVEDVTVILDGTGVSKGFGFVKLESEAAATNAIAALDRQVFMGRRVVVSHSNKPMPGKRGWGLRNALPDGNPPSRTLYIGNLSFQMSDRDLNDLFRDLKNITDVRVAIDRTSGSPRGFCHADFVTVADAEAAKKYLESKMIFGRKLHLDFSRTSRMAPPR